jgi:hypothetical protein
LHYVCGYLILHSLYSSLGRLAFGDRFLRGIDIPRLTTNVLGGLNHVELVLTGIERAPSEPEANTADESENGDGCVVPDKQRVRGEWDKSLTESSRECVLEKVDTWLRVSELLYVLLEIWQTYP